MMMTRGAYGLDTIQEWMQSVIMHPDGVAAGVGSEAARRHIDVSVGRVGEVIRPSRRQTSVERLQVYANAYYSRLLECLREEFPALAHALGPATFDAFAFGYLQDYPSQSYTLASLGRHFPNYLEETRPADETRDDGRSTWPDFLIDLARLERVYSEVFDGPGIEDKRTLVSDDLSGIPSEKWPDVRLVAAPCLRLLLLRYPVHEYTTAVRLKKEAAIPEPNPTCLVVTRRDYVVRRRAAGPVEFELLKALVGGATLGVAIEQIAETPNAQSDDFADKLHEWFSTWAALGYFLTVDAPP